MKFKVTFVLSVLSVSCNMMVRVEIALFRMELVNVIIPFVLIAKIFEASNRAYTISTSASLVVRAGTHQTALLTGVSTGSVMSYEV